MTNRAANALMLDQIEDHDELLTLLLSYFENVQVEAAAREFVFRRPGTPWSITLLADKHGHLKEGRGPTSCPDEELAAIHSMVADALVASQPGIAQTVCLSDHPCDGVFRYRNAFQLLPVPLSAPRQESSYSGYPLVLQCSYRRSSHGMIDLGRRARVIRRWLSVINGLLLPDVREDFPTFRSAWVVVDDPARKPWSEWRGLGYAYPGWTVCADEFLDVADVPRLRLVPPEQYYSVSARNAAPLALPSDFEEMLDRLSALPRTQREACERACAWIQHAKIISSDFRSASFAALAIALECLVPKPQACDECHQAIAMPEGRCPKCGQPKLGLTKAFRDFAEECMPADGPGSGSRTQLYKMRSGLVHGIRLLFGDPEPAPLTGRPDEGETVRDMSRLVVSAVHKWLGRGTSRATGHSASGVSG